MPRETKAEREARLAEAAAAEAADRAKADLDLEVIAELEQEAGRPLTKDELAERRAAKATAEADRELEAEMGGHQDDGDAAATSGNGNGGGGSGSIAERAQESPQHEAIDPDDGQGMFVWEQGRKVTLATLIARNVKIEHAFVFGGKRSKGAGELMGFDAEPLMIVRGKPGAVKLVPTYDDDEKLEKVVIESHVRAVIVKNADSDEGLALLGAVMERRGWRYVGAEDDAAAAG